MALLEFPTSTHLVGNLLESTELAGEGAPPLGRDNVTFLGERRIFDLDAHDASLDLVELGRARIDLDAQTTGGLVDQVDCLVRQETIGNVAIRKHRSSHDCTVLNAHAVVDFVALLESAQNANRVLHVWLPHQHGLEAAGQGSIFFDVLAVLVDRRRTDCA